MEITSLKNEKVRLTRRLQARRRERQREGCLVVEGVRLCEEAAQADFLPRYVLYTLQAKQEMRAAVLLAAWAEVGVDCYEVSDEVMLACSDTETPQGLLAVVPLPHLERPQSPSLTLVLDRLRDPGNLGTILRTALAAGVEQVLLAPGTVDPTSPKVVRAGAGAHFRLPLASLGWDGITEAAAGCQVVLADAAGERTYTDVDWGERVVLIVGGETAGVCQRARALAEESISIPMAAGVESLNAAVATAVLLFEIARCHPALQRAG
jgi:TrmH family RNA methyltransferase